MSDALTSKSMSLELLEVVERAKREPEGRFHSLAHLIDVPALERAYRRMRKDAAVGVDGVTKEAYGQELQQQLTDLHARLKAKQYRHQPIRRVHIPKAGGKTRPIGISAFEDKLVQDAVREVLEAVYEQDFLDCSYGFRPGRSTHDAIRRLDHIVHRGEVSWILEADVVSFLDASSYCTPICCNAVKEARRRVRKLDSQAFSASLIDVHGLKLAALYTLQDRLAAHAENVSCFEHRDVTGRGLVDKLPA